MKMLKIAQRKDKNGKTHKMSLYFDGDYWRFKYTWFVGTKDEESGHTNSAFDSKIEALLKLKDVLLSNDFKQEDCSLFKKEYKGAVMAGITALNSLNSEQNNMHAFYLSEFLDLFF